MRAVGLTDWGIQNVRAQDANDPAPDRKKFYGS
jgi:hypothetical protein